MDSRMIEVLLDALDVNARHGLPIESKYVPTIINTLRWYAEFVEKVGHTRQAQKSYFKTKNTKVLQRSKMLEEQVDKLIDEYQSPTLGL